MKLCGRYLSAITLGFCILLLAYCYNGCIDTAVLSFHYLRNTGGRAEGGPSSPLPHPGCQASEEVPNKPPRDLIDAVMSFAQYRTLASSIISRKKERFERLSSRHRALADAIGYTSQFDTAMRAIQLNANFAGQIAAFARQRYGWPVEVEEMDESGLDFGWVDMAFGHLSRDWSEQGRAERAQVFPPILEALKGEFPWSQGKNVLVPGSGLGRLAHEIANAGFNVDACEYGYATILPYNFLINETSRPFQHTLQPFITKWTHQLNPTARFEPIAFPDMLPNPTVKFVEGDFLLEFPESQVYDAIVTLFFIDVSENIVDFLENIHRLLKPGGLWVNLGPMKWGTHTQMQLSVQEVLELAELIGFDVHHNSRQSIESVYAHRPQTLLKYTYITQFWTARKA